MVYLRVRIQELDHLSYNSRKIKVLIFRKRLIIICHISLQSIVPVVPVLDGKPALIKHRYKIDIQLQFFTIALYISITAYVPVIFFIEIKRLVDNRFLKPGCILSHAFSLYEHPRLNLIKHTVLRVLGHIVLKHIQAKRLYRADEHIRETNRAFQILFARSVYS